MGAAGLGELVNIFSVVRTFQAQLTLSAVPHRIRYLLAATNLEPLFETVDSDHQALARSVPSGTSGHVMPKHSLPAPIDIRPLTPKTASLRATP